MVERSYYLTQCKHSATFVQSLNSALDGSSAKVIFAAHVLNGPWLAVPL